MRTATVLVSPALQVAEVDFLFPSATKSTLCAPALAAMPILGVMPSGLPSSTTRDAGMELKLSVQPPEAAAVFGAGSAAGASFLAVATARPPLPGFAAGASLLPVSA